MASEQTVPTSFDRLRIFCGASTINHYMGPEHAPLIIGKTRFSYVEIARRTGLPAGRTARLITAIAKDHQAHSIADLYRKSSPSSVAVHGFGAGSLLMLFRLFESEGLDVFRWARADDYWHHDKNDAFTTWTTYKKREQDAEKRTLTTPGPTDRDTRKRAMKDQRTADRKHGIN